MCQQIYLFIQIKQSSRSKEVFTHQMIEIYNIKFEAVDKLFTTKSKKLIRFSINVKNLQKSQNLASMSKQKCKFINQSNIQWQQKISIKEVYNQDIQFEIYNQHQFGFNPQELGDIYYGVISFRQDKNMGKWQVFSSNQNGKKVGNLYANYRKFLKQTTLNSKKQQNIMNKLLTSIIVRNLSNAPQKVYLVIKTSKKVFKSQITTQIKGQFFFNLLFKNNQYLVRLSDDKEIVNIVLFDQNESIIGKSFYEYKNQGTIVKKNLVRQEDGKKVGQVYFQIQQQSTEKKQKNEQNKAQAQSKIKTSAFQAVEGSAQNNYMQPKSSQNQKYNDKLSKKYDLKSFSSIQNQEATNNLKQSKVPYSSSINISRLRSLSSGNLMTLGESKFLSTSRRKRVSVVQNNGDVIIPSQKRFMLYQDKQTNIISYSKLPSMNFEQAQSRKYYKGASIGRGGKYDFTFFYRDNPGVGQYKLPSIFDKYY